MYKRPAETFSLAANPISPKLIPFCLSMSLKATTQSIVHQMKPGNREVAVIVCIWSLHCGRIYKSSAQRGGKKGEEERMFRTMARKRAICLTLDSFDRKKRQKEARRCPFFFFFLLLLISRSGQTESNPQSPRLDLGPERTEFRIICWQSPEHLEKMRDLNPFARANSVYVMYLPDNCDFSGFFNRPNGIFLFRLWWEIKEGIKKILLRMRSSSFIYVYSLVFLLRQGRRPAVARR